MPREWSPRFFWIGLLNGVFNVLLAGFFAGQALWLAHGHPFSSATATRMQIVIDTMVALILSLLAVWWTRRAMVHRRSTRTAAGNEHDER